MENNIPQHESDWTLLKRIGLVDGFRPKMTVKMVKNAMSLATYASIHQMMI
jgi:hypothetical protein